MTNESKPHPEAIPEDDTPTIYKAIIVPYRTHAEALEAAKGYGSDATVEWSDAGGLGVWVVTVTGFDAEAAGLAAADAGDWVPQPDLEAEANARLAAKPKPPEGWG